MYRAIYLFVFIIITTITWFTPKFLDDYSYMNIYSVFKPSLRISTIDDFIHSVYFHWHTINGRLFNLVYPIFTVFLDKAFFNIINGVMFCTLIYYMNSISFHKTHNKKINILLLTIVLLWFFIPHMNESVFWGSGTVNYLWSTTVSLIYVCFFFKLSKNDSKVSIITLCIYGLFSFLSGMCHEVISFAVLLSMLFWLVHKRFSVDFKMWVVGICYFLGACICLLSPGILGRASNATNSLSLNQYIIEFISYIINSKALLSLYIILFILYVKNSNYFLSIVKRYYFFMCILISTSIFFMLIKFQGCGRGIFFQEICAIIIIIGIISDYYNKFKLNYIVKAICLYIIIVLPFEIYKSYQCFLYDKEIWKQINAHNIVIRNPSKSISNNIINGKFIFYNTSIDGLNFNVQQFFNNHDLKVKFLYRDIYDCIYLDKKDNLEESDNHVFNFENKVFVSKKDNSLSIKFHTWLPLSFMNNFLNKYLNSRKYESSFYDINGEKWYLTGYGNKSFSIIDVLIKEISYE